MDETPVDEVEALEAPMEKGMDAGDESSSPAASGSDEWQDADDLGDELGESPSESAGPDGSDSAEDESADSTSDEEGADDGDASAESSGGEADDETDDRRGPGPGADLTDEQLIERTLSLLFASPDPLSVGRLVGLLERPPAARVRTALEAIRHQLESGPLPVQLRALKGGYTLMTVPEMGDVVGRLAKGSPIERISPAALETLAIVAYRQPVTKAEIEAIRGVQAGPILRSLVDRGLAKVTGRADVPGHPLQYGTTKDFLDRFGLMSLEELPRDAELAKD